MNAPISAPTLTFSGSVLCLIHRFMPFEEVKLPPSEPNPGVLFVWGHFNSFS
jgi:hypothetical protein